MADVASLAVALHLNSASFKSQIHNAYNSAANESKKFTQQIEASSSESERAITKISAQVRRSSGQAIAGFGNLHHVLTELVSGSNVAASTISNALVPAFEKFFGASHGSSFEVQREAAKEAAQGAVEAAQASIEAAKADATRAQQGLKTAQAMKEQAAAQIEQAVAADEYIEKMRVVNEQNGYFNRAEMDKEYAAQHEANARIIAEADLATAAANKKAAVASAQLTTAQAAEEVGSKQLATAKQQLAVANKELTTLQSITGKVTTGFSTFVTMMGGPVNVGLMAAAGAIFYLHSRLKEAEERQKSFYAAIQKGNSTLTTTTAELNDLAKKLGGTASAYKAVASAASAGFTGTLLNDAAELGSKLEEAGGSADTLVNKLANIGENPLQALRNYASEGVVLEDSIYNQIAALLRQGQTESALDLARNEYAKKQKQNFEEATNLAKEYKKVNDEANQSMRVMLAASTGSMIIYTSAHDAEMKKRSESLDKQKKDNEEALQSEQQLAKFEIDTLLKINAAMDAGKDKLAERNQLQQAINDRYKKGALSAKEYQQAIKGLDKLYSAPKVESGQQRVDQLQKKTAELRAQVKERDKIVSSSRALAAFEQELMGLKGKNLTADQKSVVAHADKIRTQLQINAGLEQELKLKELRKQFDDQNFEIAKATAQLQQEAQNTVLSTSMSDNAYQLMLQEQQIRDSFRDRRYQLDKELSDKTSQLYADQTNFLAQEEQKQIEIVRNAAQKKAEEEKNAFAGMKAGMRNYGSEVKDVNSVMQHITENTMQSMEDLLTDFVTTGKFNFADFAQSVVNDITRMIIKMMLFNALKKGLSSFGGGDVSEAAANAKDNVYQSPGLSAYSNTIVKSPTIFPFAKGMGLMGEAGPEAIIPLRRGADGSLGVRAIGNSSTTEITINQTIHVSGNGDKALYDAMQQAAEMGARQGANDAIARIQRDFATNGRTRKILGA
ncbi:phage tail tape measure protein [Arsenophonus sp. aPb]|uniref:phage tail tape measure protein n=1 Tax=Arsenophonus sp. aPb TaxID=3041619 RepID=UPI002468E9C2|nr:phage tail tape measure protein [Arsenophonus sp. aPb]WGL97234.1 phage tail tape measure protein [Arsenophonus sp. aPb]